MSSNLRRLYRYRELLFMITWRDIKVKYKQSVMGLMWAVLMPLLIVCAGILVKYGIAHLSGRKLALSDLATVSVKAVPWAFVVASIRFGTNSLLANQNLVTKINFPKEIFPIAAVLSSFFDFVVASLILTACLAVALDGASIQLLWLPVLVAILVVLATSVALILATLNLFFRDVKYLVEVMLTFAIFFTPVLYEVDMFGKLGRILLINPVAPLLEGMNACVVARTSPDVWWVAYSAVVSVLLLWFSYSKFKRLEPIFAENI